jgi:hypothetical protein
MQALSFSSAVTNLCRRFTLRRHVRHRALLHTVQGDSRRDPRNGAQSPRIPSRPAPAAQTPAPPLHVPARPCMPQVMPPEIVDPRARERRIPSLRTDLYHRLAPKAEHARRALAELLLHDCHRLFVQRHRDCPSRLRLIGMPPRHLSRQIYLPPFETDDVSRPQAGRKQERRHIREMLGWRLVVIVDAKDSLRRVRIDEHQYRFPLREQTVLALDHLAGGQVHNLRKGRQAVATRRGTCDYS